MPITLMTAPSVITPRSANQLRKAKQLSGTATASNKSRFTVSVSGLPPHVILALLVVRTTPSKKFRNQRPCRMHGGISTRDWVLRLSRRPARRARGQPQTRGRSQRACAILVLLIGTVDAEAMPRGALGVSRKLRSCCRNINWTEGPAKNLPSAGGFVQKSTAKSHTQLLFYADSLTGGFRLCSNWNSPK